MVVFSGYIRSTIGRNYDELRKYVLTWQRYRYNLVELHHHNARQKPLCLRGQARTWKTTHDVTRQTGNRTGMNKLQKMQKCQRCFSFFSFPNRLYRRIWRGTLLNLVHFKHWIIHLNFSISSVCFYAEITYGILPLAVSDCGEESDEVEARTRIHYTNIHKAIA